MIITVTPNPAIDKIYWVERLCLDDGELPVMRATRSYLTAGGKGINVSIFLARMGIENIAMGFIAGETGRAVERRVRDEGITTNFIWVEGETRTNVTILERGHEQRPIQITEQGPTVSPEALKRFIVQYKRALSRARYVFLGGSLPPGVPVQFYQELTHLAHQHRVPVIVNAAGEALAHALTERPWLIKPDTRQHRNVSGVSLRTPQEIVSAGKAWIADGIGAVLVSHHITHDLLITREGVWDLEACDVRFKNLLGAEDALIAGTLSAIVQGASLLEATRFGMAAATASAESEELVVTDRTAIERVLPRIQIEQL
ncbi:MAG: 1-phosphofructokinase family hexose kinase [Candidatus Bipolaricaulota bacterium]|nr:1-phosphofructokinase family hexose kinase [Candidatus Bipolaricaulota bacterium]MDW8031681.1 1-phosphofructokinase family hexose kinase [Candidatus Bipolaricaulota bacterium]